jgi:hypothetical protein
MENLIDFISVPIGIADDKLITQDISSSILIPTIKRWCELMRTKISNWGMLYQTNSQKNVCDFLALWSANSLYDAVKAAKTENYFILIKPNCSFMENKQKVSISLFLAKINNQIRIICIGMLWDEFYPFYKDYLDQEQGNAAFLPSQFMSEELFQYNALTKFILPIIVQKIPV